MKVKQERKAPPTVQSKASVSGVAGRQSHPYQSTPATRSTSSQQLPQPPEFILKHSEPIDLGRLVDNHSEHARPRRTASQDQNLPGSGWQTPYSYGMPTPELVHELSPELQAMLFAQERLRSNGLLPSSLAAANDFLSGSISASSSSSSLLSTLKSSRSPIVLEELAFQRPTSGMRPSALDIAQKYRQQQLQQNLLPTPPNSSSPVWSSTFSPYQGGLLSPEMLAAAGLSHFNAHYLSSQNVPPRMDASQELLRQNFVNLGHDNRLSRLAPAAHISNFNGQKLPPRLASDYARRRVTPEDISIHPPGLSTKEYGLTSSPAVPKVPPNTPHGTSSAYGPRRLGGTAQSSLAPTSPTSEPPRNVPGLELPQHARSIPLSRLVQRRLSTVPEEDYASSAGGRTPPHAIRTSAEGPTRGSSGLQLFLSPTSRSDVNSASLGFAGDTIGTTYGTGDIGKSGQKAQNMTPSVKLPGIPATGPGPASHVEPHRVREAFRRQGSTNVSNDSDGGGRRGEGGRGRGQKRGSRGKKARGGAPITRGTERVDGGIVVKS